MFVTEHKRRQMNNKRNHSDCNVFCVSVNDVCGENEYKRYFFVNDYVVFSTLFFLLFSFILFVSLLFRRFVMLLWQCIQLIYIYFCIFSFFVLCCSGCFLLTPPFSFTNGSRRFGNTFFIRNISFCTFYNFSNF